MNDDKENHSRKLRVNWKILVLILIVIPAGIGMVAVQKYVKDYSLRLIQVERHLPVESEKGKNLIGIAEKTLENESIDTRYLLPGTIVEHSSYDPSNSPILKFSGTKIFYNAKVYTDHNLTDRETSAVFAADLSRYNMDNQSYGEIWEYGENYSLNARNNVLEVVDNRSNKVTLKILNYSVIQNEEQTGTIVNEINKKFEKAQRGFHIDKEGPVVIIDAPGHTGNLKNAGDLLVEVAFCNSSPCVMRMEEKSQESERNGWVEYNITYRIKYLNASDW